MKHINIRKTYVEQLNQRYGDRWLYIGRRNRQKRLQGSALANPYKRAPGAEAGSTLNRYREWLWSKIQNQDKEVLEELRKIDDETVLVCWCDEFEKCHASVVVAAARWLASHGI